MNLRFFSFLLLYTLLSCQNNDTDIHIHDRHIHSFNQIKNIADKKGPLTLILIDYHHDSAPGPADQNQDLSSFNWVGGLINLDLITEVYWISEKELIVPEINAKNKWLADSLSKDIIAQRDSKSSIIHTIDWLELNKLNLNTPFVISLDLDILSLGHSLKPDIFLEEILTYINNHNPELVTISLSAAYHTNPGDAWKWLTKCWSTLGKENRIYLEVGKEAPSPESLEELASWEKWSNIYVSANGEYSFAPGWDLWNYAPASLFNIWKSSPPLINNNKESKFFDSISNSLENILLIEKEYPPECILEMAISGIESIESSWNNIPDTEPYYESSSIPNGFAFRIIGQKGDRGCMAFYQGIDNFKEAIPLAALSAAFFDPRYEAVKINEWKELEIELSIFSKFNPMDSPLDFIPGWDTLILEKGEDRTLLQGSIAIERNLSRITFLESITRKAGLPPGEWKKENITFYKAPTTSVRFKTNINSR